MQTIAGDLLLQRWAVQREQAERRPANRALYGCLREAILDGGLSAGARLPASRDLAAVLDVSRNTVKHAYEQLLAEGYLRALTGSGTFVADVLPEQVLWTRPGEPAPVHAAPQPLRRLSRRGSAVVAGAVASPVQWGAFVPGVPDVTEFPHRKFERITARWRHSPPAEWLSYASGGGHPELRVALAEYLRQARSVACAPEQILITEGVHQAVDLAARLLADPGDCVWLEEPGYWGVRSVLGINGLRLRAMPVDGEGLAIPATRATPPRLIFATPSHQYPLGSLMSLRRRLRLLEYARRHRSWIIEDDYDSEFRFSGHPVPSLQGLTPHAPVIYIGTFSKTMYPGLRVAYMVLPASLAEEFASAHSELYREGHLLTQAALAAFIGEGHYAAHVRRMRLIYAERRSTLLALIERQLGPGWIHPYDSNAGLHLVLRLPDAVDDVRVALAARARGVIVQPLSRYYARAPREHGLLLGFACVAPGAMHAPLEILVGIIREELAVTDGKRRREG